MKLGSGGAVAAMIRRTGGKLLCVLLVGVLATGCSRYAMNAPMAWSMKPQLRSVDESSPHGVLSLQRNSRNIYILVDDRAAFRTIEGNEATFLLSPGTHEIQAIYTATEDGSAIRSGTLKSTFDLRAGGRFAIGVVTSGGSIRFVRP